MCLVEPYIGSYAAFIQLFSKCKSNKAVIRGGGGGTHHSRAKNELNMQTVSLWIQINSPPVFKREVLQVDMRLNKFINLFHGFGHFVIPVYSNVHF